MAHDRYNAFIPLAADDLQSVKSAGIWQPSTGAEIKMKRKERKGKER
jgi:hypothetical protein